MYKRRSWMIALLTVLGVGCSNKLQELRQETKEEPPAAASSTSAVPITTPLPATAANPKTPNAPEHSTSDEGVSLGPENTSISFVGSSLLSKQAGSFDNFDGRIEFESDDPQEARISLTIEMDSLSTNISLLTNHLKRADFLDVEHYPQAKFVSKRILQVPGGGVNHTITGDMTIHGVTKTLEIPARISIADKLVSLDATFDLHQSEFGMEKGAKKTDDVVPVTVSARVRRR